MSRQVKLCRPKRIYLCDADGSDEEAEELTEKLLSRGTLVKLDNMENCYLCITDPPDVARVESKTFIVTRDKYQTVPHVAERVRGIIGNWKSPEDMDNELGERFPGSMKGPIMYVLQFRMGPIGSPLSKVGVQLTDFNTWC